MGKRPMKFKYVIRITLLVLFVALLTLTLISIFAQPKASKKIDFGALSSVQNEVKMTSKMAYDPESNQLIVDVSVETFQMPELVSEAFFAGLFLSNETGFTYTQVSNTVEVLSDYQIKGKFIFSYTEGTQILTLHLFDLEERKFNFAVPEAVPTDPEK